MRFLGTALVLLSLGCGFDSSATVNDDVFDAGAQGIDGATSTDAGPDAPDAGVGMTNASRCMNAGGSWDGSLCTFVNPGNTNITCPDGLSCVIACSQEDGCLNTTTTCGLASVCAVQCSVASSCGNFTCTGPGACTLSCLNPGSCEGNTECSAAGCDINCGPDSCTGNTLCAESTSCSITCTGDGACAGSTQCDGGIDCTILCAGNACSGQVSCDVSGICVTPCEDGSCDSGVDCTAQSCGITCARSNGTTNSCTKGQSCANIPGLTCSVAMNACEC